MVERFLGVEEVVGSNPVVPTINMAWEALHLLRMEGFDIFSKD